MKYKQLMQILREFPDAIVSGDFVYYYKSDWCINRKTGQIAYHGDNHPKLSRLQRWIVRTVCEYHHPLNDEQRNEISRYHMIMVGLYALAVTAMFIMLTT